MKAAALVLALVAGTWLGGWWAVPLLAAGWGYRTNLAAWQAGAAAAGAWSLLLLTLPWAAALRLAPRLGGVLGTPGWVAVLLPPIFAFLLGWSAARLAVALRRPPDAR